MKEDEQIFEEVSVYVRDNPGVPLSVVAKELDISYDKLMKYVREGRLLVRTNNGGYAKFCEKCGEMINDGRFCPGCEDHINAVLETSKFALQSKIADYEKNKSEYRYHAFDKKSGR
jgi:hypothetical protein